MFDPTDLVDIQTEDYSGYYEYKYGLDIAHLSRHWYERDDGLYYLFTHYDLRKWAHHSQIKLLEEGKKGYLFQITLKGIQHVNEKAPFMNIEIAEPEPLFDE